VGEFELVVGWGCGVGMLAEVGQLAGKAVEFSEKYRVLF
jgi:hypothetical protein